MLVPVSASSFWNSLRQEYKLGWCFFALPNFMAIYDTAKEQVPRILILPSKRSLRFIFSLILSHRLIHTLDTHAECKKIFVDEFWIAEFDGQLWHNETDEDPRMWDVKSTDPRGSRSTVCKCESADFSLHAWHSARQHSAEAPCTLCRIHCCTQGSLHFGTLQRYPAPRYSAAASCTSVLCSGTLHLGTRQWHPTPSAWFIAHPRRLHREIVGGSRQLSSLKFGNEKESASIAARR